jgi:hypothetical protein
MNEVLTSSITVVIVDRRQRAVDGELLKVGTAVTVDLGIEVRKDTSLQQRIFSKVNAANNVARLELARLANCRVVCSICQLTMTCSVSAK